MDCANPVAGATPARATQAAMESIHEAGRNVGDLAVKRPSVVLNIRVSFEKINATNGGKNGFCHGKDQALDLSRPALLFCAVV